jgi:hypothetical protein
MVGFTPRRGGGRGGVVIVEELPGVCTVGYDAQVRAVVMTWLKNDDTAFRPMLEIQLRTIAEQHAACVIVDTSQVRGVLNDANQDWLVTDFFPRLNTSGLKALISVTPQSAIAALVNRRSFREPVGLSFDIVECQSLADARARAAGYATQRP